MAQLDESGRTTRILTTDFPHYFAVVTRVRQEVHAIGPEGGMVSSSVVPQVQAVFPQGALTKKIKVGLQAQPIPAELAAKLLGNRVAVSPIVTVEPRRRKFHKPITLTIPKPQAANKGMINNYSGDAPTLRLLCSITGGTTRAQWEDVTGSTPFTFVNDCVSFTTTVSARFWLMDCRNVGDATKMATELYREAIHVPFMAKFVVFAKRVDPLEARLRIFCMTDDKEDKTLEHQEHFTEVAKSRDVEVLEGKTQYVEFAGNLVPVTKSGEQLQLSFRGFRENRLPFTVRVKDPHADCVGRTLFMREARLPKGEPPQQPICVLNIVLPEEIIPEASLPEHELHKYSFIQDSSGLESYQRVDLRLSDVSNLLGDDWVRLAEVLEVEPSDINRLKTEHPQSVAQQGLAMLRLWMSQGNKAQASTLESALSQIGRDDIVQQCVFNTDQSSRLLKDDSRDASLRRSIPYSDKDIMKDSESVEDLSRTSYKKFGHFQEKDDKEERKYEAEEKEVDEVNKSVSERRREIEKRLSMDKQLEKQAETMQEKLIADKEDFSEKEIAEEKRVSSPEEEPSELSFQQKRLSFEQGKRVIEMKPDKTTMKEVKDRAKDERFLAEERKLSESQKKEEEKLIDDSSIPFEEKRRSFEQKEEDLNKENIKKEEQRRDSALFEGVSQGLVRLDAAFTATPQVQDLLSPKVSKTPPPSPAEFKDLTGTVAWTDDSPPAVVSANIDQSQDWAEKGKPDSSLDPSKKEASQTEPSELGPTGDDTSLLLPTPTPRPLSDTSNESSDQQISSDDIQDYSVRKKFWEQMSTSSQESQRSQDGSTPPVPKPRLSIVSSVPLLKPEGESDTETTATTLSDSTVRIKNLQQDAVSKQSFTGSSDASDKDEGSETEAVEKPRALFSVSTTAETVVHDTTHEQGQKTGLPAAESSDSEGEYIATHGQENLAYENTGFIPDEDTESIEDKSLVREESTDSFTVPSSKLTDKSQPIAATRKTFYERSVSLPTEEITDVSENSVKAKKRFFESQIKKEMVVDQLMMQNEEESSPEHKSFHDKQSDLTTSDPETMVSRQIHSHIFSHELEEQIESLVPENKHISEVKDESSAIVQTVVTAVGDTPDKVDAKKCVKRTDSVTYETEIVQVKLDSTLPMETSTTSKSVKEIKSAFEVQSQQLNKSVNENEKVQKFDQYESFGDISYLDSKHKISEEVAEVIKYRSDSISKPSDSLEVHIDKSEIEETEKEMELDEDIKRIEAGFEDFAKTTYKETEEEVIPDITITLSGKQRPDSYSQGESEDTQSESDITPEDLREKETSSKFHEWEQEVTVDVENVPDNKVPVSPHVHTPEEHIPDTVWEVPIQQEPETSEQETVEDIPIEKQPILEKDEEESQRSLTESCEMKSDFHQAQHDVIETDHHGSIEGELSLTESALEFKGIHSSMTKHRLSEEEAREIAKEIVNHIEDEISKRSETIIEMCEDTNLPTTGSELSNTEVSDYIKKLTGKEDVEVKLIESVLAKKQREQILKLSRADTTSSMEITDEDLRSSGVETDISPLESQGSRLCPVEDKSDDDTTEDFLKHEKDLDDDLEKLKEKEVLEKTLAEVKESLEAAQDELIEEQKKKKEVLKKQSPSEFEFKVLTLEKYADEFIRESVVEEASVFVDFKGKSDQPTTSSILESQLIETNVLKGETHSSSLDEVSHIKSGDVEQLIEKQEIDTCQIQSSQREIEVGETSRTVTDTKEIKSFQKGSASYSDDEERVGHSKTHENITLTSEGHVAESFTEHRENKSAEIEESFDFNEIKEIDSQGKHMIMEEQKNQNRKSGNFEVRSEIKESTTVLKDNGDCVTELTIQNTSVSKTSVIQSQESHTYLKTETNTTAVTEEADNSFSQGVVHENIMFEKPGDDSSKIYIIEKEEIKRTLSDESQKSSQDESIKSPSGVDHISSSSSSGRKGDSDTMHTIDRPEIVFRKHKTTSSNQKRGEVRSGADYEPYSSSGESYYQSFEQTSESIRTPSRPCSSDVDALIAGVGTTGSSEYESAVSHDVSAKSFTSYEYHTAVSSLSSRESMKSLDSESSGNLASVEISSEASETLIPSAMELESDMEGFSMAEGEKNCIKLRQVLEPYEREIPHHVIKGESPPHIPTLSEVRDYDRSTSLDISSECGVSEDEAEASSSVSKDIEIMDASSKMKRSHEMTFQPEPRPVVYENVLPDAMSQEEKLGSSIDDSASILSSSMSETAAMQTVIERSRTESERMDGSATSDQLSLTVSGTSEQLSFSSESREDISIQQSIKHETVSTQSVNNDNQVDSVLLMTSSINTDGIQSVCTQVTSQSKLSPLNVDEIAEDNRSCSNGPTQVEYNAEYDDVKDIKKRSGHRRNESTSFKVSAIPILKKGVEGNLTLKGNVVERTEDVAESDKYTDLKPLTSKEYQNDEKKDIDEAEKIEEESYQTEADQGFHRDMREGRNISHDMSSLEEEHEELMGLEGSRPQSQISKSDSEGGHRHMSSGFSDDRPDSELAELLKQCSSDAGSEDPIERPKTPEPSEDCEIKDDTPEFSSEAQASVTELEMEYSGAFSRTMEYESHVSPIREKIGLNWEHVASDHEEELAEAEAAFQMVPHSPHIISGVHPDTILEDPIAEKHELETKEMALKEEMRKRKAQIESTSPGSIPDITVTQHMTPLKDRGFHYPDLELEEALTKVQVHQTPVSIASRESSETDTNQREQTLGDDILEDLNIEEPDIGDVSVTTEERTVFETREEIPERDSASDSPTSDSFEMLEKPDIADDFVIIEEVGKEAREQDQEGKSVAIGKRRVVKKRDDVEDEIVVSPPAPVTRMTDIKYYPDGSAPFPFDSDSPPTNVESTQSGDGTSQEGSPPSDVEQYESDVEAGKKWIEMQFQGDQATAVYGYELDYERGPLEDIKEEDATDLENNSSRFGSLGSQVSQSAGSFGSMKESYGSTPDYDVLAGRKYFTRSGEHDDVSMSSLQEFERLENLIAMEIHKNRSSGSQDSLNSSGKSNRHNGSGKSAGDDISLASLKEFEGLEHACMEAAKIEIKAKEEEALLSEIEEGHESQASESESCETISAGVARGDSDEEDYEKRMFEIDEIIRQAQTNVEKFIDLKEKESVTEGIPVDKTESMGRGDSIEEVAKIPDLDLDQPLYSLSTTSVANYGGKRTIQQWKDLEDDVQTSTDSLEIKHGSTHVLRDNLTTSTDSLEVKPSSDKELMSASTDSIEFQAKQKNVKTKDVMTDSIEIIGDKTSMITSTDSLETDPPKLFSDSIDEEDGGHFAGLHDQSSSSGKGDLSSSGKEDSCEQLRMPPPRAELLLGSTDSLEPSSSTATHATYHYETDSIMSSSFTSQGSNTLMSSTETLDTGARASAWFDSDKPYVTEIIEPVIGEDGFTHTIHRTIEMPPEIHNVTFRGPEADKALKDYIERFGPGEDICESQETDEAGNIHTTRVIQKRVVIRPDEFGGPTTRLTESELDEYLQRFSDDQEESGGSFTESQTSSQISRTSITQQVISSTPKQELTSSQVKGEPAAERTSPSPVPPTTREGEEVLMDLAAGLQDAKGGSLSGPSSGK